jgi:uncharacterized protein
MMPLVHFEIHAADPERTAKFYTDIFGWTIKKWEGPFDYWLVSSKTDNIGIDGAITARRGPAPADGAAVNAFVCTISVDDLDQRIDQVKRSGGSMALDKMEVPGIGWLAYAKDPEGNLFGMLQPNQPA